MADKNIDAPIEAAPINLTKAEAIKGYDQNTGAFTE